MSWYAPAVGARPVVVLGAGVLGRHVACVFTAGGYNVNIVDPSSQARQAAVNYVTDHKDEYSSFSQSRRESGYYVAYENLAKAVRNAWLVIDAIPELSQLQIEPFGELDQHAPADCIFAANDASFEFGLTREKFSHDRRRLVVETRFVMPPEMRVVELLTDFRAEARVFPFLSSVLSRCGMMPVTARKESTGLIFNRLRTAMKRETLSILVEGLRDPAQIDALFDHVMHADTSSSQPSDLDKIGFSQDFARGRHYDSTPDYHSQQVVSSRPVNGVKGVNGVNGVNGINGHHEVNGINGIKGTNGVNGVNGINGVNGVNGVNGTHKSSKDSPLIYVLDVGIGGNLKDVGKYSSNGRIVRLDTATGEQTNIASEMGLLDGIDVSEPEGRLFYTDMGYSLSARCGSVMSMKLDGSDIQTLIPEGQVCTPKQLVVVDERREVYFCDREGMGVHRVDFDGKKHEVLVQRHSDEVDMTQWCVGITVDPEEGKVYWTQKGPSKAGKGRIFRANLDIPEGEDATNRSDIELLIDGLPEPIDLDFDVKEKVLYWTDRGEHPFGCSLYRASLIKGDQWMVREQLARHFHEPIGLRLDPVERNVYVTDLGGGLYSVNLDTKEKKVIVQGDACYCGITVSRTRV